MLGSYNVRKDNVRKDDVWQDDVWQFDVKKLGQLILECVDWRSLCNSFVKVERTFIENLV